MTTPTPSAHSGEQGKPSDRAIAQIADALDCFWNAALGATHSYSDVTANAVMAGMVQGFAAVSARLRELERSSPQPSASETPSAKDAGPITWSNLCPMCRRVVDEQDDDGVSSVETPTGVWNISHATLRIVYNTLQHYANRFTYLPERIGGVVAGCPRGNKPTPDNLVRDARLALEILERHRPAAIAAQRKERES